MVKLEKQKNSESQKNNKIEFDTHAEEFTGQKAARCLLFSLDAARLCPEKVHNVQTQISNSDTKQVLQDCTKTPNRGSCILHAVYAPMSISNFLLFTEAGLAPQVLLR